MSSLSATQADGYYIPPSYVDSGQYKKKSVQQFNHPNHKSHNQYLTRNVVRFELPYDGFCLNPKCRAHVGKGTRFNAEKKHVDNYHTSKIYEFRMKCRACKCVGPNNEYMFVIRTNPREQKFDYVSGIKLKNEEFDTVEAKSLGVIDTEYGHAIHNFTNGSLDVNADTMTKSSAIDQLEKQIMDKRKAMTDRDAMEYLLRHNQTTMYDDASSNAKLRAGYRVQRKAKKRRLEDAKVLGLGKGIELCAKDDRVHMYEDTVVSRAAFDKKEVRDAKSRTKEQIKFRSIRTAGIFSKKVGESEPEKEPERMASLFRASVSRSVKIESEDGEKCNHEKRKINISIQDGKVTSTTSKVLRTIHQDIVVKKEEADIDDFTRGQVSNTHSSLMALAEYGSDSDSD